MWTDDCLKYMRYYQNWIIYPEESISKFLLILLYHDFKSDIIYILKLERLIKFFSFFSKKN